MCALQASICPGGTYSSVHRLRSVRGCHRVGPGYYAPKGSRAPIACPNAGYRCPGARHVPPSDEQSNEGAQPKPLDTGTIRKTEAREYEVDERSIDLTIGLNQSGGANVPPLPPPPPSAATAAVAAAAAASGGSGSAAAQSEASASAVAAAAASGGSISPAASSALAAGAEEPRWEAVAEDILAALLAIPPDLINVSVSAAANRSAVGGGGGGSGSGRRLQAAAGADGGGDASSSSVVELVVAVLALAPVENAAELERTLTFSLRPTTLLDVLSRATSAPKCPQIYLGTQCAHLGCISAASRLFLQVFAEDPILGPLVTSIERMPGVSARRVNHTGLAEVEG